MMAFMVDDLLDFAQINAGKFRISKKTFDLKEAIEEVIQIQKDKANMGGIKLQTQYKVQNEQITTLFNKLKEEKDYDLSFAKKPVNSNF